VTAVTTTVDAIEDLVDNVFPEPDGEPGDGTAQGDPRLADLIWALSLSAGRIPLLP